jgi:2,3-bisphosphoglycerate-dependent phosphoglycerate mutase
MHSTQTCTCSAIPEMLQLQRAQKVIRCMTDPARLVLARHGETDWNRERRMQGQSTAAPEACLTQLGTEQAQQLGRHLKGRFPDAAAIVTSDLKRAVQARNSPLLSMHAP